MFSYLNRIITNLFKIIMNVDAQIQRKHLTKMLTVLTESFSVQQLNVFPPSSQESLLPKDTDSKGFCFCRSYSTISMSFPLSVCQADLTDQGSFVFIAAATQCKTSHTWMGKAFCPSPPK